MILGSVRVCAYCCLLCYVIGDRHVDPITISCSVWPRPAAQVARYVRLGTDHAVTSLLFSVLDCTFRISTGIPTIQTGVLRGFSQSRT